MSIVYFLFFLFSNFLIFSSLTEKIEVNSKIKIGLIAYLSCVIVLHFLDPVDASISNEYFFYLILFSLALFIFHFGSKLSILILKRVNSKLEDHPVFSVFNVLRFYIVYILVFVYQCVSLLFDGF